MRKISSSLQHLLCLYFFPFLIKSSKRKKNRKKKKEYEFA